MNDLVAESCRKCCNKNQAVEMIKNSHEHLENIFDGTLNVSLLMLSDTHFSEETGREIRHLKKAIRIINILITVI